MANRDELRKEAERITEDAEFTGYQHLAAGQRWRMWATRLGLPATLVATAASAGAGVWALTGGEPWISALLGLVGALAAAVRLFFRPDEQADAHSGKGARYISLRDDARRFANTVAASSLTDDTLTERVEQLGDRLNGLRDAPPREIPHDLYEKVKKQIEAGNYRHKVDGG